MYRLLTTIRAKPYMQQTRLKGGTEGEAPPIEKGGDEIAPTMSWENTLGAGERWRYD